MATNTETLLYRPRRGGALGAGTITPTPGVAVPEAADDPDAPAAIPEGTVSESPASDPSASSAAASSRAASSPSPSSVPSSSPSSEPKLFAGSVRPAVGDRLPTLERTLGLVDLVAYGAATWDWHRLHYDAEHAAEVGLAGPVVDGQMFGALLAEQIVRWLGGAGRIGRLHFRNRAPVHPGSTICCEGEVVDVGRAGCVVSQRVLVDGVPVVEPAGAEIRLDGAM